MVLSWQQPVKINFKNEGLYLCMYVQVYFSLLMVSWLFSLNLQFTESRGMDSIAAGKELSLLQPDSFDNQISGQRITLMDHMAWNLKKKRGN